MIISKIYDYLKKEGKEDELVAILAIALGVGLGAGLTVGLAIALGAGLGAGLVAMLVVWLAVGLGAGLAVALTFGLVAMLAVGLVAGSVLGFVYIAPILCGLGGLPVKILVFFMIMEMIYLLDKRKPSKNAGVFWFTVKRKIDSGFDVLIMIGVLGMVKLLCDVISEYNELFMRVFGWVGIGMVGLVLLYGYVKLNSLRYKKRWKK